jgi:hypothetical protein
VFGHFDILLEENQEVREGLKTYSNWPTYPQLYSKGNLLGGLDIMEELRDGGELADALGVTPAEDLDTRMGKLIVRVFCPAYHRARPPRWLSTLHSIIEP